MSHALLRVNMAQSLDGHTIQPDGRWALGSAEDKRRMDKLRLWADYIIASRRSIENDNPNLFVRSKPNSQKHPIPIIVLKDTKRKISCDRRIFQKPHPIGEFWVSSQKEISVNDILEKKNFSPEIHGKWKVQVWQKASDIYQGLLNQGARKILLEGGPTLNGIFLKEDLIDEFYFTKVPYIWAGNSTDRIVTGKEFLSMKKFKLINMEQRKNEVYFRYKKIRLQ